MSLDLLDCPVTRVNGYREKVFELLPSLTSLDGLTRQGEEVEESDSEQEEEEEGESVKLSMRQSYSRLLLQQTGTVMVDRVWTTFSES